MIIKYFTAMRLCPLGFISESDFIKSYGGLIKLKHFMLVLYICCKSIAVIALAITVVVAIVVNVI